MVNKIKENKENKKKRLRKKKVKIKKFLKIIKKQKSNSNSNNLKNTIKKTENINETKNKHQIDNIFHSSIDNNNFDNLIKGNEGVKNVNFVQNLHFEDSSKLNFAQIKQKFKQIDINYGENNLSILNHIDRLTSILSNIIVTQNEQKNKKEIIKKSNDEKSKNEDVHNPLIIDANNDKHLNFLLSLNDTIKKKISNVIKFDEIDKFFTNFAFEKIENIINILKFNN